MGTDLETNQTNLQQRSFRRMEKGRASAHRIRLLAVQALDAAGTDKLHAGKTFFDKLVTQLRADPKGAVTWLLGLLPKEQEQPAGQGNNTFNINGLPGEYLIGLKQSNDERRVAIAARPSGTSGVHDPVTIENDW